VVVKLLFKVVTRKLNYLKVVEGHFVYLLISVRLLILTGTVYWLITTVLLKWERPTWYKRMQLDRLTMKQLLCAHRHQHCLSDIT